MRIDLRPDPASAVQARRFVREALPELPLEVIMDVELVVTELVTNSVRHAGIGPDHVITLSVESNADLVQVRVDDRGQGFAAGAPDPTERSEGGFGLRIVDRIANSWGTNGRGLIWANVPRAARD